MMVSLTARLGLLPAVKIGNILTAGLEKATGKTFGRQTTKELAATKAGKVLGIATVGTAAVLGGVLAGPAAVVRGAASLIPKTPIGKGIALVGGGILAVSPTARKAAIQTPSRIFEAGEAIGGKIEALPKEEKEIGAKGGLLGLAAAAIFGAGAVAAIPAIAGKIEDSGKLLPEKTLPTDEGKLLTPAVQELTPTRRKRAKKKALQPLRQTISQRVNVRVGVNAGNRKYISNVLYN